MSQQQEIPVFIGLGSNIGDTAAQLTRARELVETSIGPIKAQSREYLSEPWGITEQPWFRNQVILVHSALSAAQILQKLLDIETAMGRTRRHKNEPRTIDLDLLFYGDEVIETASLQVPHPRLIYRNFVLIPLLDIAPEMLHPVTGLRMEEHYWMNEDPLEVLLSS